MTYVFYIENLQGKTQNPSYQKQESKKFTDNKNGDWLKRCSSEWSLLHFRNKICTSKIELTLISFNNNNITKKTTKYYEPQNFRTSFNVIFRFRQQLTSYEIQNLRKKQNKEIGVEDYRKLLRLRRLNQYATSYSCSHSGEHGLRFFEIEEDLFFKRRHCYDCSLPSTYSNRVGEFWLRLGIVESVIVYGAPFYYL